MKTFNNFDLTKYNSYRLIASCDTAYFPDNEEDIISIFNSDGRKIILGNGNNIILSKKWYDEEFVIFSDCFDKIVVKHSDITAEAGATMLQMSEKALEHALSGFEVFYDIPSSIGGAVVMNAGSGDEEIKDLLLKVRYLDLSDMEFKEITPDKMEFEYRNSIFQKKTDKVVMKAWFRLTPGNPEIIKAKMEEIKQKRWEKQPRNYPNCGSVFKRPSGLFVGPMLDELGLKGFTVGGASISDKHSGFIINSGFATGENILSLINLVQTRVREKFGVNLELEQRII